MEFRLISFMKDNSCLHDKFSPLFKCKRTRELKWRELSNELGIGVPELQKRWKTLRDRFRREDKRYMQSDNTRPVKWKYFRSLRFLKGYCEETDNLFLQNENGTVYPPNVPCERPYPDTKEFKLEVKVPRKRQSSAASKKKTGQIANVTPKQEIIIQEINPFLDTANKGAFQTTTTTTSVVKAFFNSIAIQVEQANLSFERLAYVQQEVLRVVNEQIHEQRRDQIAESVAYTNLV